MLAGKATGLAATGIEGAYRVRLGLAGTGIAQVS